MLLSEAHHNVTALEGHGHLRLLAALAPAERGTVELDDPGKLVGCVASREWPADALEHRPYGVK